MLAMPKQLINAVKRKCNLTETDVIHKAVTQYRRRLYAFERQGRPSKHAFPNPYSL